MPIIRLSPSINVSCPFLFQTKVEEMQMVKHYNKQESHNSLRETKSLPPWLSIIIIAAMIVEHDVATYKKRISDYLLEDVERGDTDRWWIVVLYWCSSVCGSSINYATNAFQVRYEYAVSSMFNAEL